VRNARLDACIKISCNLHPALPNALIAARQPATFFLMKTDEKDMETDIKKLARAHAAAAIQVLAEIMTNPDAPAAARISAAKALLDRGFGKVTAEKPQPESRGERVVRFERVIIDPPQPHPERDRGYIQPANDQLPGEEHGQQDEDQAQRAPPEVCDYGDYNRNGSAGPPRAKARGGAKSLRPLAQVRLA